MTAPLADPARLAQIQHNLAGLRARVAAACAAAGRRSDEITIIAVTKTFGVPDVVALSAAGLVEVGENRDQEAAPKAAECAALGLNVHWHFIGQLQVNKCASVVRYADVVHSVDRGRLVTALGSRARAAGRTVTCLIQVALDDAPGRGGAAPDQVGALADAVTGEPGLILAGVMAVAPLGQPARPAFARLRSVADRLRADHHDARIVSAGMSDDLDDAIAEGATHIRVGTALLGGRPTFVR